MRPLLYAALGTISLGLLCFAGCSGDPQTGTGGAGGATSSSASTTSVGGSGGTGGTGGSGGSGSTGSTGGGPQQCTSAAQCDDMIACTIDRCMPSPGMVLGVCAHEPQTDGACPSPQICDPSQGGCVDGPPCTTHEDCEVAFGNDPCVGLAFCQPSKTCGYLIADADGDDHVPLACGGDDCNDAANTAHPEATEVCDGLDNDCDGLTDGDDPSTDYALPSGCGTCDLDCFATLLHVDPATVACVPSPMPGETPGTCVATCEAGHFDLDGDNSCEYACTKTSDVEVCNDGLDNDCDGKTDSGPGCP